MFETRNYRVLFFVSLILSAVLHLCLLWIVRVDVGPNDDLIWRSIGEIRKFFLVTAPERERAFSSRIVVVDIESFEEDREEVIPPEREEKDKVASAAEEVDEEAESAIGIVRPFDIDSLDLLLSFPWLSPAVEEDSESTGLTGLERALTALRELAEARRKEEEELILDTKYGKFGISEEGIHVGSIVIPLPLAPYMSGERRAEERAFGEIQEQSTRTYLEDEDLEGQRERVIEWKRRRDEGP